MNEELSDWTIETRLMNEVRNQSRLREGIKEFTPWLSQAIPISAME